MILIVATNKQPVLKATTSRINIWTWHCFSISFLSVRLSHGLQVKFKVSGQISVEFAIIYHVIYIMRRQIPSLISFKCFRKPSMVDSLNCLKGNPPLLKCPMRYMVRVVIETIYIVNLCYFWRWVRAIRSIKINRTLLIIWKIALISWGIITESWGITWRMSAQVYGYIRCATGHLCHARCASIGYSCYSTCIWLSGGY